MGRYKGKIIYWQEGKVEVFNVEELHQGRTDLINDGVLYVDVNPDTKIEL